ncbi:MAG TPA: hypothetical protein VJ914_20095 [Pseudonocardiaceae bacterium]|nr:hypothetical protein [Pseudonocardiaceae bacterium]
MYWIRPDDEVADQIAALPSKALEPFAEVLALLEVAPEAGLLCNDEKPDGLRDVLFGPNKEGKLTYLLLVDQREVHLLRLIWVDLGEDHPDV